MKNREKFAKEILDIACEGKIITVTKDNKVVCCGDIDCEQCLFDIGKSCHGIEQWAESEYIEKPTITSKEKAFLDLLLPKWKYIVRDKDETLFVFDETPIKSSNFWHIKDISNDCSHLDSDIFIVKFDFIKWEDEEPWSIEDLKKLNVKDE